MARGEGQYVYTGKSRLRRKFKFMKLFGTPDNGRRRKTKKDTNNNQSAVAYSTLVQHETDPWGDLQLLNPLALDRRRGLTSNHKEVNVDLDGGSHVNEILSHSCKFCQDPGDLLDEDYFSDGSSDSEELVPLVEVVYLKPQYGKKMPLFGKKKKEESKPVQEKVNTENDEQTNKPGPPEQPVSKNIDTEASKTEELKKKADDENDSPAKETPAEETQPEESPEAKEKTKLAENGTSETIELTEGGDDAPASKKTVEDQPGGMLCCTIM